MPAISLEKLPSLKGYLALPLHEAVPLMPLQACLVFRADPPALVSLREELFSAAYLACLVDASGRVHEWLELVCRSPHMIDTEFTYRDPSNPHVDQELQRRLAFDRRQNAEAVFTLPGSNTPALFIDPAAKAVVSLQGPKDAQPWELCTDDAILIKAGLPRYSTTEFQYLYCPSASEEARTFIPISAAAPSGKATVEIESINPKAKIWVLLTIGGTLSLRQFAGLSFAAYTDLLGGTAPAKLLHGKQELDIFDGPPINPSTEAMAIATGRLLCTHTGLSGKMCEALHLKLQALTDAISAVRKALAATQRPLLTLTEADFRVQIARIGPNLPAFWNTSITLRPPTDTIELKLDADHQYFVPNVVAPSIYTAPAAGATARGSASIRMRKITADAGGSVIFEGTISSQERLKAGNSDLVLMKLNLGGIPLTLASHLEVEKALARSEFRFRSNPIQIEEAVRARLAPFEGAWVEGVTFEVLPLLSSPSDLFSLAVLAMRALLVDRDFPLPFALDEIMSLANEASAEQGRLVDKIGRLFGADPRWVKALGPQRLCDEAIDPAAALDLVPKALWFEILAWIIQMIPKACPESYSADFGQAPPGRIETVLDPALREARRLLTCTRSLLVVDWQMNRDVGSAIRDVLKEVAGVK